ncbi:MAG: DNA-3-methyladenine glycosylase [Xanthomonadales bacterium]|nr:DNA-3-methyladenine glycosylase [Xanthomonadales bacterium]
MNFERAAAALRQSDPRFVPVIRRCPEPESFVRPFDSAFEPLARSIVYQQLSGKAAASIFGRFLDAFGKNGRPCSASLAGRDESHLREVGLSRQKARYILGLAEACREGRLPDRAKLEQMDDEAAIDALSAFKGIGRWTAEMVLMFWMGRPDVLPVDDLGIRKGVQVLDELDDLPAPAAVLERGEPWRPYRTLASWYLWRVQEL